MNPNQLHAAAAVTATAPAETTAAPAVPAPAPAPAVTANQASQVQPSTEGQINMAPTLTAEQQALIAALSPETMATLLALAQAAGSLPKPAASTASAVEPTRRGKRKPAGAAAAAEHAGEASRKSRRPTEETATAESKKIKEQPKFDGNMKRRGFGGGKRSNFTLEQQATVARICIGEFGFPTRHDWHTRMKQSWETIKQEHSFLSGLPPPQYNQVYKWLKHHDSSGSAPAAAAPEAPPSSDFELCCDAEMVRVPPPVVPDVEDPEKSGDAAGPAVQEARPTGTANPDDDMLTRILDASAEVESQSRLPPVQIDKSSSKAKCNHVPNSMVLALEKSSAYFRKHGCEKLELLNAGSYGHVFGLAGADGKRLGSVMKVSTAAFSRRTSLKHMATEAGSMRLSYTLENLSAAQDRREIQRCGFAARPADGIGGPSGLVFLPIDPCVDKGHAALFMEEAARPLEDLLKAMAHMYFTDKNGALHSAAMPHLATVVRSLVHNLYWMGRCSIAHGDLKGQNVMLSYKLRGGPESILRDENGKKAVPLLVDFGNATLPGIHHVWAKEEDLGRYDPTTETFGKEPQHGTPARGAATARAQKVLAESQGEARTELRPAPRPFYHDIHEYSLKELHLQTATVPSSMPPDEPPPWPVASIKSWGGTEGFIPPEGNRKPPDGTRIRSADRMPGDMYALGIMLLQVLSGYDVTSRVPQDRADKKSLCEAELPCIWHTFLKKTTRAHSEDPIPEEWMDAVDFLQDTLALRPDLRLTPAKALQHPFIQLAEKFHPEDIPTAQGKARRARP